MKERLLAADKQHKQKKLELKVQKITDIVIEPLLLEEDFVEESWSPYISYEMFFNDMPKYPDVKTSKVDQK